MVTGRKRLVLVVVAVVLAAPAYADMMPVVGCDAQPFGDDGFTRCQTCFPSPGSPWSEPDTVDAGFSSVGFPIDVASQRSTFVDRQRPIIVLVDQQSSTTLCLYALMGLGLFKSSLGMRKFVSGVIPAWYHEGGPFQIRHASVISPDCLPSYVACFVQPEDVGEDLTLKKYCEGTFGPLYRKSQFIPTALASRAPPVLTNVPMFALDVA